MDARDFTKIVHPGMKHPSWAKRGFNVFCEIEYKNERLSIHGVEGPTHGGNARGGCGQIDPVKVDTFAPGWNQETLDKLNNIWERWHLNDMRPGCVHQQAEGWHKIKLDDSKDTGWHVDQHANLAQWARPSEHPRGVLGKPCPVCGYKFGTSWNLEQVPNDVLDWLKALPDTDVTPAWV